MMVPNTMCSPPNPAAMHHVPQAAGVNSATVPTNMQQSPITETIRTEKAPPVTKPAPYKSSQAPGNACHSRVVDGGRLADHRRAADRQGHDRFAEPRREPQLDARLPGGDEGRGERGDADGDLSPSWDRGERPRAFHGLADEAQIIEGLIAQRMRGGHKREL